MANFTIQCFKKKDIYSSFFFLPAAKTVFFSDFQSETCILALLNIE